METIKFNDSEITKEFNDCTLLQDVILKIENKLRPEGIVVCKIMVNGLAFSEKDEGRFANTGLSDIRSLEFEVQEVNALVWDSVQSVVQFIKDVKGEVIVTAEYFRSGDLAEAQIRFAKIISFIQELTDALLALKPNLYRQMSSALNPFDEQWVKNETHMIQTVQELVKGFEVQDYILTSDVLEYELYTSLDKWLEFFEKRKA